ncbi:LPXTG cell wall anchor domain-containing protein [Streptomyces sp. LMG1-1-1.1]|uniref:LPXTG cell wall anchor domain-containing protein n=1 Tax=Streptomyces sp. LMG1-1-1.1 TaxID=3135245 RepID=UPI0034679D27
MRRTLISSGALVAAVAGSLVLAPAALASDGANHPTLRQELPLKAADFENTEAECLGVPANQDGWHFVLPGGTADFVELKVTFVPGGTQTITDFSKFGNPAGKHAYVASAPGAELTNVEATITGGPLPGKGNKFPLSHTCPATPVTETTTPGTETTTPGTETTTPGTETTTPGTETTTPGTETTAPGTESPTPGETTPGGSESPSASTSAGQTGGSDTKGEGDLAETGSSAPVGMLAAAALALAAAGAVLVTRRRKAQQ